jgi:exopolyphosphatase/pppGpp-phosphohydrolase
MTGHRPVMSTRAVAGRSIGAPNQPWDAALAVLDERLRGGGVDAADLSHRLAAMIEDIGALVAAEALHRHAALLLTPHPSEPGLDRRRVDWACCLAANLRKQRRLAEAEQVLLAAVVLGEALLGADRPQTEAARSRLHELWNETEG